MIESMKLATAIVQKNNAKQSAAESVMGDLFSQKYHCLEMAGSPTLSPSQQAFFTAKAQQWQQLIDSFLS